MFPFEIVYRVRAIEELRFVSQNVAVADRLHREERSLKRAMPRGFQLAEARSKVWLGCVLLSQRRVSHVRQPLATQQHVARGCGCLR